MQVAIELKATVTLTVTNGPGNIRDYVALYAPGAANYSDWLYVATGTKTKALKGKTAGVVKFANLKLGKYEAKLFSLTDAGVATLRETMPVLAEQNPGSNIFVTDNSGVRVLDNSRAEVTV